MQQIDFLMCYIEISRLSFHPVPPLCVICEEGQAGTRGISQLRGFVGNHQIVATRSSGGLTHTCMDEWLEQVWGLYKFQRFLLLGERSEQV